MTTDSLASLVRSRPHLKERLRKALHGIVTVSSHGMLNGSVASGPGVSKR